LTDLLPYTVRLGQGIQATRDLQAIPRMLLMEILTLPPPALPK